MALHTIVEHDTTHIKPYIDAKDNELKQALSDLGLTVVDGKLCAVYNT